MNLLAHKIGAIAIVILGCWLLLRGHDEIGPVVIGLGVLDILRYGPTGE